jgi:hypothetical protein
MERTLLLHQIEARLGDVDLVWFGTRGDDVEAAADVTQLRAAFSVVAEYRGRTGVQSGALEDLTGVRPDLDTFEIDDDPRSEAMVSLRRAVLRTLARPSAVFTYRPSTFVSAVCFARRDRCRYLGLFKDHQSAFEHKPWVETAVAELGLPHIPWTYVADDDQLDTLNFLHDGPVVLRRSRTNGGVGLVRIDEGSQLDALWPQQDEAYVSVAPYIADGLPVNVGGVAWDDGVTVHHASVQLIGVPGCTVRPFGYCGNDFGAMANLDPVLVDRLERATVTIGNWLRSFGYRGAFGVDFLIAGGVPLFTEVNPRFQGSTHASCQISVEQGQSCLLTEHLAAHLGLPAPRSRPLAEQARESGPFAHLVVHWPHEPAHVDPTPLVDMALCAGGAFRADVLTSPSLQTQTGATVARITTRDLVTTSGFDLVGRLRKVVEAWAAETKTEGRQISGPAGPGGGAGAVARNYAGE